MRVVRIVLLVIMTALMPWGAAQDAPGNENPQAQPADAQPANAQAATPSRPAGERRRTGPGQETRQLLEQVMIARLSKELSLDDEQTVLLVRRFAEQKQEIVSLNRERQARMRALGAAVDEGKDEDLIEERLAAVRDIDTKLHIAKTATLESLGEGLTAWQRARLYLFLMQFENDMKRLLQQARERSQPAGEGRPGRRANANAPQPEPETDADSDAAPAPEAAAGEP